VCAFEPTSVPVTPVGGPNGTEHRRLAMFRMWRSGCRSSETTMYRFPKKVAIAAIAVLASAFSIPTAAAVTVVAKNGASSPQAWFVNHSNTSPHLSTIAADSADKTPDLAQAVGYLVSGTNLVGDNHYESSPGSPDFGLTIDGALALAAAGSANSTLSKMVSYIAGNANGWTGIDTANVIGGALGDEALLAEVTGQDPRSFGGNNLIKSLDASVCARANSSSCAGAGNYSYGTSVFDQALGIIAQLRAGDTANASSPISYLASLQNPDGGWPALIPPGSGATSDVDSTAMAVMALSLVPSQSASVNRGITWIASQQLAGGGFPGAAGDNTNSAALALMAMDLKKSAYDSQIEETLAFLADRQNSDGGFGVTADDPASDLRASTQAVSGIVGTSFATLSDPLGTLPATTTPTTTPTTVPSAAKTTPSTEPARSEAATSSPSSSPSASSSASPSTSSSASTSSQLAATGAPSAKMIFLGLALVLIGLLLAIGARAIRTASGADFKAGRASRK
jgi:hypothetical protein